MSALDKVLALEPVSDTIFRAQISEDWMQGRTTYGGLSSALALTAAKQAFPGEQPLRSALISFIGPVAGECEISVRQVRASKSSRFIMAEVTSTNEAGELTYGTHALFTFSNARESHVDHANLPMPEIAPPEELEPLPFHPMRPAFTRHFDMRPSNGPELPMGQEEAEILAWVRFGEEPAVDTDIGLLALGDALPPAALTLFRQFGPVSSMNWTVHMLVDQPQTRDGWWLLHSRAEHSERGFSVQEMTVWNRDGQAVARGGQGVGIFV